MKGLSTISIKPSTKRSCLVWAEQERESKKYGLFCWSWIIFFTRSQEWALVFTSESWDRDPRTKNDLSWDCKYPTRCAKSSSAELKLFRHQILPRLPLQPFPCLEYLHDLSLFAIHSPKPLKHWFLRFQPRSNWVRFSQRVQNLWDCAECTQKSFL